MFGYIYVKVIFINLYCLDVSIKIAFGCVITKMGMKLFFLVNKMGMIFFGRKYYSTNFNCFVRLAKLILSKNTPKSKPIVKEQNSLTCLSLYSTLQFVSRIFIHSPSSSLNLLLFFFRILSTISPSPSLHN
jgi:hypothetical protein